ncbi:MAG: putative DNA binding domain-containing protein [Christensenellaceae bacterium]|jgi:ATP-dependent DNA helicase RecG|nr:putative DNA binding domain-containing protein [Christensenellaceae bacterium]
MTSEALLDLIKKVQIERCETQTIEIKAAREGTPKKLYDTLSSFSNQDNGGVIIFGVDEESGFAAVGVYDAQDLQKKVGEQCKQMEPEVRPLFTVLEFDGKMFVSAEIAGIEIEFRPCFYKGVGRLKGAYTRVGDADLVMSEYEVYSYESYKRKIHDDLNLAPRATFADIDKDKLDEYLTRLKLAKPRFAGLAYEDILRLQGIALDGKPTVAGVMLFGKFPQSFFPQLSVTAMVAVGNDAFEYTGRDERFIDNRRIEGTIPEMLDETIGFVRRNMKISTVVDRRTGKRADKEEFPLVAIREAVLNSLIHRDYSIHTSSSPIRLIIYRNRLEIENPGGLYGRLTVTELGKTASDTRNEFIAGIFEILINSENRFTGVPTIQGAMKEAGLPEPLFENRRGAFKVTLYNDGAKKELSKTEQRLLAFCKRSRDRDEIAEFLGVGTTAYITKKYIRPLIESGRLKLTIPSIPKSPKQQYVSE